MIVNNQWQQRKVNKIAPEKLHTVLQEEDFYILDVRPRDFIQKASFLRGSFFCPLVHLAKWYRRIPKDRPIIITDWAMRQSIIAAKFLSSKEYQVYGVLKGGIERWKAEKLPVAEQESDLDLGSWYIPQE